MGKMDFGEILKKWEHGNINNSKKTEMESWLEKNDIYDKDFHEKKTSLPGENRRRLLNLKADAIIDIHGFSNDEAWYKLEDFFKNAKINGYEKIRIIHGKGNHSQGESILRQTVRKFIEQCDFAGESGFEKSIHGGSGATWVLLKN
ncbi:MAG: Smr/MutS family protein [Treponema sp.]|nr:Smr/MutS family protein [Treponema sp.]